MAAVSFNILFKRLLEVAPDIAIKYGPKLLKAGQEGIEYIQNFIRINDLKGKNSKQDKLIDGYYLKIGKAICDGNIVVDNIVIKDNVKRVRECEKEKNKNTNRIKEIECLMKKSKILDDAEEICDKTDKQRQKSKKVIAKNAIAKRFAKKKK